MAITLKEAFALNGTPNLTSFKSLQSNCVNPSYFTSSNPINYLSSWEGFVKGSVTLSGDSYVYIGKGYYLTATVKIPTDVRVSSYSWSDDLGWSYGSTTQQCYFYVPSNASVLSRNEVVCAVKLSDGSTIYGYHWFYIQDGNWDDSSSGSGGGGSDSSDSSN